MNGDEIPYGHDVNGDNPRNALAERKKKKIYRYARQAR